MGNVCNQVCLQLFVLMGTLYHKPLARGTSRAPLVREERQTAHRLGRGKWFCRACRPACASARTLITKRFMPQTQDSDEQTASRRILMGTTISRRPYLPNGRQAEAVPVPVFAPSVRGTSGSSRPHRFCRAYALRLTDVPAAECAPMSIIPI